MSSIPFPKAVFSNFITSLRTALFLPIHNRPAFFVTAPHFLVALLFSFCCGLVLWAYWLWPVDSFSVYGLASYLGRSAWLYFWIAAILSAFGLSNRFLRLAITLCYATPLGLLAGVIVTSAFQMGYIPSSLWIVAIYGAAYLFYATSISRIIWTSANAARWKAIPIAGLVIAASITGSFVADNAPLFEKNYDQTASNEAEDTYKPVSAEAIYYAQSTLMADETAQLHTQTKGVRDTYAILGAGYAEQSVFLSEVTAVKQLFADTYGANSSTITLANSRPHPTQHPLLNPINLRNAVEIAAQKMDLEEDTLVLFLTSHGSPERIAASFYELNPSPISSFELADILDTSGAKNIVVVLSACYAGSFIDDIEGEGRTIITAAAADRTSFGCADGRDWTYFGRAFFDEAFRKTGNFPDSFEIAKTLVHEWETEGGQTPSLPQISINGQRAQQTASR